MINSYNLLNSASVATADFLWAQGWGIYLFFTGDALEKCHSESCISVWRSLSRQLKERKNLKVSLVVFQVKEVKVISKTEFLLTTQNIPISTSYQFYLKIDPNRREVFSELPPDIITWENVTELSFRNQNHLSIWGELSSGNTMGFGTEGSLVLKNENRKRISNKEFQVFSDWIVTVFDCQQYSLEISPRSQRESKKKVSGSQTTNIGKQCHQVPLLLWSSLHIVFLMFNFSRKLDITDIVQRLDIYKTGYLTHLVNVADNFLYFIHFALQEVKFASQILFRYFGIFNVSIGIGRLDFLYRLVLLRSESGWWRLASVKRTKLGKTFIDNFTIQYLSDQHNNFY